MLFFLQIIKQEHTYKEITKNGQEDYYLYLKMKKKGLNIFLEMNFDLFCERVRVQIKDITGKDPVSPQRSTPIICPTCNAPAVKPNIVLFRSSLPQEFFQNVTEDVKNVDLLIIIGTSLHVAPANSIVWRVPKTCMRVLINREAVGWHLGMNLNPGESKRDFFAEGNCEDTALDLLEKLVN